MVLTRACVSGSGVVILVEPVDEQVLRTSTERADVGGGLEAFSQFVGAQLQLDAVRCSAIHRWVR